MNKKGKLAPLVVGLIIFVILAITVIGYMVIENQALAPTPGSGQSTTDCNVAPSLGFSVVNALQKGTGVTVIESVRLNDVLQTPGTVPTAFQYGDKVLVFYNATDYIDNIGPEHSMTCGKNTLSNEIYKTDQATIRIFNTDGTRVGNAVTSACNINALVNQSESTSAISMKIEIQSAPLQTTGDLVMVVSWGNSTESGYSDLSLSGTGVTDATVPSFYVANSTASVLRAFNIPASVNGALTTYYLNVNPKSGQTLGVSTAGTFLKISLYSKQAFIDTDGNFKVGIEDANGATKYEDLTTHGVCVNN